MTTLTPIKITVYYSTLQAKEKALTELRSAMTFINRIPELADPEKFTDEVKADLEVRKARIEAFILQTENERDELLEAHKQAIADGQFKEYQPGGVATS